MLPVRSWYDVTFTMMQLASYGEDAAVTRPIWGGRRSSRKNEIRAKALRASNNYLDRGRRKCGVLEKYKD